MQYFTAEKNSWATSSKRVHFSIVDVIEVNNLQSKYV